MASKQRPSRTSATPLKLPCDAVRFGTTLGEDGLQSVEVELNWGFLPAEVNRALFVRAKTTAISLSTEELQDANSSLEDVIGEVSDDLGATGIMLLYMEYGAIDVLAQFYGTDFVQLNIDKPSVLVKGKVANDAKSFLVPDYEFPADTKEEDILRATAALNLLFYTAQVRVALDSAADESALKVVRYAAFAAMLAGRCEAKSSTDLKAYWTKPRWLWEGYQKAGMAHSPDKRQRALRRYDELLAAGEQKKTAEKKIQQELNIAPRTLRGYIARRKSLAAS